MRKHPGTEILIVTPVRNGAQTLRRTLHNIASLAGPVRVVHHVQDGDSRDGTQALLERWARVAAWGGVGSGCAEYQFSWSSAPDRGLYDAVAKGFEAYGGADRQWLGWINCDDVLLPDAAGVLAALDRDFPESGPAWVGGRVRAAKEGQVLTEHDRPACRALLQEGLYDGLHFPPVQQEGTFFRRGLWSMIDAELDFARLRLAGDWNLWRAFAAREPLYQVDRALGEFTLRPGQLSAVEADEYRLEIERELPFESRAESFRRLARNGDVYWRQRLLTQWPSGQLYAEPELVDWFKATVADHADDREAFAKQECKASRKPVSATTSKPVTVKHGGRVIGVDANWQTPAVTERHAFDKVVEFWPDGKRGAYLGFPWATLIDLQNHWSPRRRELEAALANAVEKLPEGVPIATVCQHIHARRIAPLLAGVGVTDIFWSHATQAVAQLNGMAVHPFPLFPVQRSEGGPLKRDLLYSFVGARVDSWYPTMTRNWIIDHLTGRRGGLIVERSGWHYERAVYGEQIHGESSAVPALEAAREAEFRRALSRSVFALCPSGTGPNTLRVWEAMEAGAIPVILSDHWLPPGGHDPWCSAAVFVDETEADVRALPKRLSRMAKDHRAINAMREAGRNLLARYGPDYFVGDIIEWASM